MSLKFSTSELKTSLKKAFRDFEKKDSIGAQLADELHVKLFLTSPRGKAKKPSKKEEPVEEKKPKVKKPSKKAKEEEPVEEKKKPKAKKEPVDDEKPKAKKTAEKPEEKKGKKNEKVVEFNEEHQQWMDENGFVFNKDSKTVIGIIKEGVISRLLPEDIEFAKTLRYRVQEGEESQEEEKKEEEPSQAGAPKEDEDDDGKDIQTQMEEELAAISDLDISQEQFELYNSLKDKFSSDSEIAKEMNVKPNVVRFIADNYASLIEKFPAATAKKTLKKKVK